jgi:hypothetical protein
VCVVRQLGVTERFHSYNGAAPIAHIRSQDPERVGSLKLTELDGSWV